MEKSERRQVSLAGLGLIGAGAVLGLALATPSAAPEAVRPAPATQQQKTPPPGEA